MRAAIRAADAGSLVERGLAGAGVVTGRIWIIAAGKAAPGMAGAAVRQLGSAVAGGVMIGPAGSQAVPPLDLIEAEHPVPGRGSERGGRRARAVARAARADDCLVVLLSGGASALMAMPAAGLTLEDKRRATETLLRSGADIVALNTVRKHLSEVKGGRLAACSQAACQTFAVSDVVGDDLSAIGSGPTVPDPTTFADALDTLRRFGGVLAYPEAVVACLTEGARGERPETPKPGAAVLRRSVASVIGGRQEAMRGAGDEARALGYAVIALDNPVVGEARAVAKPHCERALAVASSMPGPRCVISSGETTVVVSGSGRGGRNQEFTLAAAELLATLTSPAVVASVGTDGVDGPTTAAGAIADGTTLRRARALGLSPADALADNNSYAFFAALDDLITTGPTGTNVGDLQIVLTA